MPQKSVRSIVFQVPTSGDNDTLTCLTVLNKSSQQHNSSNNKGTEVVDVAICWNYLVVGDTSGITKYGLVNNKPCLERYEGEQSGIVRGSINYPRRLDRSSRVAQKNN